MDQEAQDMNRTRRVPKYSSWRVFQQDLVSFDRHTNRWLRSLSDWLFLFNGAGARRRLHLFIGASLLLWIFLALLAHPPGRGLDPLLTQIFSAMFAADVLRHFVVLALALWLAQRLAANYVDDVFELNDIAAAEHFMSQSLFSGPNEYLVIRDGSIPHEYLNSPLYRIGGPGLVDVHLENAALFERVDGTPHVIGPTHQQAVALDGFERLRRVVDLRDHILELDVEERTQDGIMVQAKDVRLVFSVYRGNNLNPPRAGFEQPYPFTTDAVLALVYQQGSRPWNQAMEEIVRSELRQFISMHTLSEFLSNADLTPNESSFVPRDQLTQQLYEFASARAAERGVQLNWVGVGTWVTPSELIPARHMDAWRLTSEARSLKHPELLAKLSSDSRMAELLRLIDEVLFTFYSLIEEDLPPEMVTRQLMLQYREKLRNARELYHNQNQPQPPELRRVIHHLDIVGAVHPEKKP